METFDSCGFLIWLCSLSACLVVAPSLVAMRTGRARHAAKV